MIVGKNTTSSFGEHPQIAMPLTNSKVVFLHKNPCIPLSTICTAGPLYLRMTSFNRLRIRFYCLLIYFYSNQIDHCQTTLRFQLLLGCYNHVCPHFCHLVFLALPAQKIYPKIKIVSYFVV